jgi:outer membrane protein assembly factor BamB
LNAATGALVWSYLTGGIVFSSPAVANGVVYIRSSDTKVYAFGVHDVAVTDFKTSRTVVGLGSSINLNVVVANLGSYPETCNVTIYANTSIIAAFGFYAIGAGSPINFTFNWNTAGFVYGNYNITASAISFQEK